MKNIQMKRYDEKYSNPWDSNFKNILIFLEIKEEKKDGMEKIHILRVVILNIIYIFFLGEYFMNILKSMRREFA